MGTLVLKATEDANAIKSETYTAQTYRLLREAILNHELKSGEVYSQDQISNMLNISRTPVREALLELQKDGYIRFLRGRGFELTAFNKKELEDMLEVRIIIECAAANMAARRISDAQTKRLGELLEAQRIFCLSGEEDASVFLSFDEEFHKLIWDESSNHWISKVTCDLRSQLVRNSYDILTATAQTREIYQEHSLIWEAISKQDALGAEQAMAHHINNTRERNRMLM